MCRLGVLLWLMLTHCHSNGSLEHLNKMRAISDACTFPTMTSQNVTKAFRRTMCSCVQLLQKHHNYLKYWWFVTEGGSEHKKLWIEQLGLKCGRKCGGFLFQFFLTTKPEGSCPHPTNKQLQHRITFLQETFSSSGAGSNPIVWCGCTGGPTGWVGVLAKEEAI